MMLNVVYVLALVAALCFPPCAARKHCARVYRRENYSGRGFNIDNGKTISVLGTWNNRIFSIRVADNCKLAVYTGMNYSGHDRVFDSSFRRLGFWKGRISSCRCWCKDGKRGIATTVTGGRRAMMHMRKPIWPKKHKGKF